MKLDVTLEFQKVVLRGILHLIYRKLWTQEGRMDVKVFITGFGGV